MKIIHVTYSYHPDTMGGVEIYVAALARELAERGVECVVCAPSLHTGSYTHEGVRVHRLGGWDDRYTIETGYEPEPAAARHFGPILDAERPSLVHVHSLSHLVTFPLAHEVKRRGIPLVFTYHECGGTCRRGTLRRFNRTDCDGRMDEVRCASCTMHALGLPPTVATAVASIPAAVGRAVAGKGLRGRIWTALRTRELMARKHAAAQSFLAAADAIVATAPWVRELLSANHVPAGKLFLSPLGCDDSGTRLASPSLRTLGKRPLRLVALARLEERKGLHLLPEVFARDAALDATLDIFAVRQMGDEDYAAALAARVKADPRIRILSPIAHDEVITRMRAYHALLVPSLAIETGPLVVLEAFAAGIPVVASRVRGISELVTHGRDGLLAGVHDAHEWAEALRRLATEPGLLERLADGIAAPRTMKEVCTEMAALYARLASAHSEGSSRRETSAKGAFLAPAQSAVLWG